MKSKNDFDKSDSSRDIHLFKGFRNFIFYLGGLWIILKIIITLISAKYPNVNIPNWLDISMDIVVGPVLFAILFFIAIFIEIRKLPNELQRINRLMEIQQNNINNQTKEISNKLGKYAEELSKSFNEYENKISYQLENVSKTGIETLKTATGFIERAFSLQLMTELREKYHRILLDALVGLGFNLRNWENHITIDNGDVRQLTKDASKIHIWLGYMRTYYFEEAFDLRHKEIVTNARNFCFLILATFQAYLKTLKDDETLHYYAVTPVHPEDWYNWPHGYQKPKAHFEADFIGLFHRILREILKSKNNNNNIVHGRYILTSTEKLRKDELPFGWPILNYESARRRLENSWMIPITLPIQNLETAKCEILRAFHDYYNTLRRCFPRGRHNQLIYPLFSNEWEKQSLLEWLDKETTYVEYKYEDIFLRDKKRLEECYDILSNPKSKNDVNVKELTQIAKKYYIDSLESNLKSISPPSGCNRCEEAFSSINIDIEKILNEEDIDIPKLVEKIHHYACCLSEHDVPDKQKCLDLALKESLRLKDFTYIQDSPMQSLKEVFTKSLQSSPEKCWLVGLDKTQLRKWDESNVNPEFSFFGIKKRGQNSPTWKLIITTDLDYPFEVGKIKIYEPNDPMWDSYSKKIDSLLCYDSYKYFEIHGAKEI